LDKNGKKIASQLLRIRFNPEVTILPNMVLFTVGETKETPREAVVFIRVIADDKSKDLGLKTIECHVGKKPLRCSTTTMTSGLYRIKVSSLEPLNTDDAEDLSWRIVKNSGEVVKQTV